MAFERKAEIFEQEAKFTTLACKFETLKLYSNKVAPF